MSNTDRSINKVFISFTTNDSSLAHRLENVLGKNDISSYLFDSEKQYDSTMHNKITKAIKDSQALIAIITKGYNSTSVHEEIGYAFAKEKSVIIMLEEGAKDGVLSHEREHESFTKEKFDNACSNVLQYIQTNISKAATSIESTEFLKERGMLNDKASNFCMTPNSTNIKNVMMELNPTVHPVVLFSSCPRRLLNDISINSSQHEEWLKQFSRIPVCERLIEFLQGNKKIELGKTTYCYWDTNNFTTYVEICSNGFVEQGHTKSLISTDNFDPIEKKAMLHSHWTAGTFWAFLIFCKEHYLKYGYSDEIDIFLSIRDAQALTLVAFDECLDPPITHAWRDRVAHTNQCHIQLKKTISVKEMSNKRIEKIVREFADKTANAYGLQSVLYYNQDGVFNSDLLNAFHFR